MNIFFRVLLAIYAFCLTILSFVSMILVFRPDMFKSISSYLVENVLYSRNESIAMFIISFIFFSLSLTFLMSGFKSSKDKKGVSKHTNIGEIKISLDTLESIALGTSRKLNGVRETKASLIKHEDSVAVIIRAVVMSDINIPLLSEDIQVKVKKAIEDSSGIKVSDVKVIVENIYTGYKARVE